MSTFPFDYVLAVQVPISDAPSRRAAPRRRNASAMGRVGSDHHVVHPHARQSVHHGALALQRYLRAAAPDARAKRDAEGAWPQSPHKDTKHRNPAPHNTNNNATLKALHTGDATSLLARVVLPFAAPADPGRLEQACRFFGARTRGVVIVIGGPRG